MTGWKTENNIQHVPSLPFWIRDQDTDGKEHYETTNNSLDNLNPSSS